MHFKHVACDQDGMTFTICGLLSSVVSARMSEKRLGCKKARRAARASIAATSGHRTGGGGGIGLRCHNWIYERAVAQEVSGYSSSSPEHFRSWRLVINTKSKFQNGTFLTILPY